jgi:hypothetical protein
MMQPGRIDWCAAEGLNERLIRDPTGKPVRIDILVMVNTQDDSVHPPGGSKQSISPFGENIHPHRKKKRRRASLKRGSNDSLTRPTGFMQIELNVQPE